MCRSVKITADAGSRFFPLPYLFDIPGLKAYPDPHKEIRKINRNKKNDPLFPVTGWIVPILAFAAALLLASPAAPLFAGAPQNGAGGLFYARFDMKTVNGVVTDKNLLIVPAEEEFRAEDFRLFKASGISDHSSGIDPEAAAKHDAVSKLLIKRGLKSIANRNASLKTGAHDEIVISYEGVIRYPVTVTKKGCIKENQYAVEMELWFSPVSFPGRWATLSLKHKIWKTFDTIISVFK